MHTLIAILLYLGEICSPCTYYEHEIQHLEVVHEPVIQDIQNDTQQLNYVLDEFGEAAEQVTIIVIIEN